jgi:hypothetical protein
VPAAAGHGHGQLGRAGKDEEACAPPRLRFRHEMFPVSALAVERGGGAEEEVEEEGVDAVLTDYFIDAAAVDFADLIVAIARVLRPGGCWLNRGPLKWHQV